MTEEEQEERKEPTVWSLPRRKTADSYEPWEIVSELLKVGWERDPLRFGDYSFLTIDFKKVGIERKKIQDLIGSIGERLAKQLQGMMDYYDFTILLIEGSIKYTGGRIVTSRGIERVMMEGYRNFVRTWQDRGVTIERTSSHTDTIIRLNELYAYYQKPAHTGGVKKRQVGDPRLLAFPPTVGIKTGKIILDELGSLQTVANANLATLQSIPHVGPKRAEAVLLFYRKDERDKEKDKTIEEQLSIGL